MGVGPSERNRDTQKLFPTRDSFPMEYDKLDKKGFLFWFYSEDTNQKTFRVNETVKRRYESVSDVLKYMVMRDVDSDLGLIRFVKSHQKGCENVNYVFAQRKIDIDYRLNSLRRVGKPTSLKELGLSGRDLIKMGIRSGEGW